MHCRSLSIHGLIFQATRAIRSKPCSPSFRLRPQHSNAWSGPDFSRASGVHAHIIGDANEPQTARRRQPPTTGAGRHFTVLDAAAECPPSLRISSLIRALTGPRAPGRVLRWPLPTAASVSPRCQLKWRAEPVLADGRRDVLRRVLRGVGPPSIPIYCNVYFVSNV